MPFCAPQNIEKVDKAFKEEMARALKDGFSADELKKAKQGISQVYKGAPWTPVWLAPYETTFFIIILSRTTLNWNKNYGSNTSASSRSVAPLCGC